MKRNYETVELRCPDCSHTERLGPAEMLHRLQELGMLKRAREPEPELLHELLESSASRCRCRKCAQVGLVMRVVEEDEDEWTSERSCSACGQTISKQRLEVLPDTTTCSACAVTPASSDEAEEYCPKCGAVMQLRPSRGRGVMRYELRCPECAAATSGPAR